MILSQHTQALLDLLVGNRNNAATDPRERVCVYRGARIRYSREYCTTHDTSERVQWILKS